MNEGEREAARLKVFNRARAAMSDAGREQTRQRFDGATRALSIVTYAIAAWLYFVPVAIHLAVAATILVTLMWLALLRMLSVKGPGFLDASCLIFLGLAALMRALLNVELVDPMQLAWPSIAAGGIIGLGFAGTQDEKLWQFLIVSFTMIATASLVALANVAYDSSKPQLFSVKVDSKRISRGYKGPATYHLHFAPAPGLAALDVREASVSEGFHDRTQIGERLCFAVHTGFLRMPWYYVSPLANCPRG